jgi:aspartate beta-hydroxylase
MASPDSSDGGDRGIVYVATVNDRFVAEAFLSAETVKQRHPELPITLFTDRPRHPLCKLGCFDSVEPIERVQTFGSSWAAGQLARLRCLPRTPHARTLHLDTDTRVLTEELPWLFDRLGEADVAMVETAEDDSYSRLYSGLRMFNAGLILYRRTEQVWKWLDTWARLTERNFRLADQSPLPALPLLGHIGAEDVRRRLLYMDQISLVEILGPERNSFDLSVLNLDYSWNHRGSQKPENNRNAVRILHTPVLKTLTHADLLAVASTWKRAGRAAPAAALQAYAETSTPDLPPEPRPGAGLDKEATMDTVVEPSTAQAAYDQAMALHGENRLDEAEALYQQVLAVQPDHGDALCYLGLLRLQQDRVADSIALLRQAIALNADAAEAHHHLGVALHRVRQYDEALAYQDAALALIPDYSDALYHRGQALQALGRGAEAIASYEAALAQAPDDAPTELGLAAALEASGRDEEAFVHWRNAAGLDPGQAEQLSQALGRYGQRQPAKAQAGMQRLNRYIGTFLTNQANARMGVYPGLASAPFHDVTRLPGALALERNYAAIKAEIEGLAAGEFQAEAEGLMERGAWDVFLFYERSRKNEENCARCPTITRVIEASNTVRTQAGLLYVSKLSPGTHIHPHLGPTNLRLRCHLGIRIPDGDCGLKVGGETRRWEEGRCIVFDDSLEHEAWNHTGEPRIVLIIDFWHPDLTPTEIAYLEGLHRFASFQAVSLNRYWSANAESRSKARKHYD